MSDENKVEKELAEIKKMIRKSHIQNIGWVALVSALALALTQSNEYRLLALVPFVIGLALFIASCYDIESKKWHWSWNI